MKLGADTTGSQRGSMGIPPDMMEAGERARVKQEKITAKKFAESKESEAKKTPEKDQNMGFFSEDSKTEEQVLQENLQMVKSLDPMEALKNIGIDFKDTDLHNLLFKGSFEAKDVDIVKGFFKASIRTLRSGEYDEVEELMEEALDKNPNMTRTHYEMTQQAYIMAYAITDLNGSTPARPVKHKDGKLDSKATAIAKHKVLMAISTTLFNKLSKTHGVIKTCIDLIAEDPELLKK